MANKTDSGKNIQEFDRKIAIEELITAGDQVASAGAHLFKIGAIDKEEFETLRVRFKSADLVPEEMSAKFIRKQAKDLRQVLVDFTARYEAADRILAREERVEKPAAKKTVKR